MISVRNHLGSVEFTKPFFVSLISETVESCFGVAAMNASGAAGIVAEKLPWFGSMFDINKGVDVRIKNGKVFIAVHISVLYGVNVSAVVSSVKNKLSYAVEEQTGLHLERTDVYIDGLIN